MAEEIINLPATEPTGVESTDDLLALAERRIEKVQKMVTMSLKVTNHQDWVNQQGKPYLMGSGAEKVARLWGVKVKEVESKKINTEDEKSRFYFYQVTGVVELPGGRDSIVALGTCSSKDQFFASMTVDGEKVLKPLSEIDETNIMKSAYTNFLVNGITRLLGIRNLQFSQLEQAGVEVSKIGSVDYGGKQMTEEGKNKKESCWKSLLALAGGDEKKAREKLKQLTEWTKKDGTIVAGKNDINRLSEKQIDILHGKLSKMEIPQTENKPTSADKPTNGNRKDVIEGLMKSAQSGDILMDIWKDLVEEVNAMHLADKSYLQGVLSKRKDELGVRS